MKNRKILITGASGFIGKNLTEQLSKEYLIFAPTTYELNLLNQFEVEKYLNDYKIDVIIHCANYRGKMQEPYSGSKVLETGLRMYSNLERCSHLYDKMLYFGSGAEYDSRHYQPFMKEDYFGRHIPQDGYGFYKYLISKQCTQKDNIYDLRLFGVYGKYEDWTRRFISNNICRALKDKPMTLSRNVYFDYIYIDDLVEIMKWFIENEPFHRHYNVCRGSHIDLLSLGNLIREVMQIERPISIAEEGYKLEYSGNNKRLLKEMGDYSFKPYKETIEEMVVYYKSILQDIDSELL
mgnify:FL=1